MRRDKYLLEKSLIISVTGLSGVVECRQREEGGGGGRFAHNTLSLSLLTSLSSILTVITANITRYELPLALPYCYSIKYLIAYLQPLSPLSLYSKLYSKYKYFSHTKHRSLRYDMHRQPPVNTHMNFSQLFTSSLKSDLYNTHLRNTNLR